MTHGIDFQRWQLQDALEAARRAALSAGPKSARRAKAKEEKAFRAFVDHVKYVAKGVV